MGWMRCLMISLAVRVGINAILRRTCLVHTQENVPETFCNEHSYSEAYDYYIDYGV